MWRQNPQKGGGHGADFGSILSSRGARTCTSSHSSTAHGAMCEPLGTGELELCTRHVAMLEAVALARYISWVALSRCL